MKTRYLLYSAVIDNCVYLRSRCLLTSNFLIFATMPLDINAFRVSSGGDPEIIRESQRRRFAPVELVDEIIANDEKWRQMTGQIDNLRKDRNTVQKAVATKMKAKEPCEEGKAEVKKIGDEILAVEEEQKSLKIVIDKQVGTNTSYLLSLRFS